MTIARMARSSTPPSGTASVSSETPPPAGSSLARLGQADYEAIRGALLETDRGRWFLAEHARRGREAEASATFEAIVHLAATIEAQIGAADTATEGAAVATSVANPASVAGAAAIGRLRSDLADMAAAIARTYGNVSGQPTPGGQAAAELHNRISDRLREIGGAAEQIEDVAWTIRRDGAETALLDRLDRTACDLHAIASDHVLIRGTREIVRLLSYVEARIDHLMTTWKADVVIAGEPDIPPAAPDWAAIKAGNPGALVTIAEPPNGAATQNAKPPQSALERPTTDESRSDCRVKSPAGGPAQVGHKLKMSDEAGATDQPALDTLTETSPDDVAVGSTPAFEEALDLLVESGRTVAMPKVVEPSMPASIGVTEQPPTTVDIPSISLSVAARAPEDPGEGFDWGPLAGEFGLPGEDRSKSEVKSAARPASSSATSSAIQSRNAGVTAAVAELDDEARLASDLFKDVMMLSAEERIALFS